MADFGTQHIKLENPVAAQFDSFIFGNACKWEQWTAKELERSAPDVWLDLAQRSRVMPQPEFNALFREKAARYCEHHYTVQQDSAKGQHIVICGAGPSLKETATEWCKKGDQVWGCNSALTWLYQHRRKVTHGFAVDQTPAMVAEWFTALDVQYLLASTCHPHLVEHLEAKGRRVQFFHNYVGIQKPPVNLGKCAGCNGEGCEDCGGRGEHMMEFEDWMYALLYPSTIRAGSGLNSVTRAIDVALFTGAEKITVLGADHALRYRKPPPKGVVAGDPQHLAWLKQHVVMHADGGHPLVSGATAMTLEGLICPRCPGNCDCKDKRLWISKPDMLISAVFLVKMARKIPHLTIVGDTLPGALMNKTDEYLSQLPHLVDSTGKEIVF